MTSPDDPTDQQPGGSTPSAPDVDQPEGGDGDAGRTPSSPDVDQPDGGDGS